MKTSIHSHKKFKCGRCKKELLSDQCYVFLDADDKLINDTYLCRDCNMEYRNRKIEFANDFLNEKPSKRF